VRWERNNLDGGCGIAVGLHQIHRRCTGEEFEVDQLLQAIRANDIETARQILHKASHRAKERDEFGTTPLHEAAEKGNNEMVRLLLTGGAEVDAQDRYKHTPLLKAVWFHNQDVVLTLLRDGANINVRDEGKHSPLHWAAFQADKEMVEVLLEHGADVGAFNRSGKPPLEYALAEGHDEIADVILKARPGVKKTEPESVLEENV